jgi:hypothetical protein
LPLYCLSFSPIYCSSFAIVLSVLLSDLLLLICHCIVCPSLWFTAPHLIGEKDRQYNGKWGAVNQREGQTIQWQMRSSKSERRTDNNCIVCPSLWFTAPHLSLYCLSIYLIYCSSFVIVLSVHLSYLLLLICHCIVWPLNQRDGNTI